MVLTRLRNPQHASLDAQLVGDGLGMRGLAWEVATRSFPHAHTGTHYQSTCASGISSESNLLCIYAKGVLEVQVKESMCTPRTEGCVLESGLLEVSMHKLAMGHHQALQVNR